MNQATQPTRKKHRFHIPCLITNPLFLSLPLFLIELLAYVLLRPSELWPLAFGLLWSVLISCLILLLPRTVSRVVYGIVYYVALLWTIAQAGYYCVFNKLMWLSTISFAGEGAVFLGDILGSFTPLWWIGSLSMLFVGALIIWKFPKSVPKPLLRLLYLLPALACLFAVYLLPSYVFIRDNSVWGTRSEYGQSRSYRAAYKTMYDAQKLYNICGIYHMTFRDIWKHEIYPLTPGYKAQQESELTQIDEYFDTREAAQSNDMSGLLSGKNVVLVLMESMDDWMITEDDTPTLYNLINEGISFTNFYTPGYGSARTINSEFCMNTGIYLPTTGRYVFDYVTNDWSQSFASQMTANGFTAEVFHYNNENFYSRGVFEPAMGYNAYTSYTDYVTDQTLLYDDCLLFDIEQVSDLFFRDGPTFNTIITRAAHLSYVYNEVLSSWGLSKYPQYRDLYGSEEESCARLKAKLVDDMFARLLSELEAKGQLENTVIIGMTDHYTYGYKNMEELLAHSGVDSQILLERVPCFVWSADIPTMQVDKAMCTADVLPTMLNLLGIDSPYNYLGQDIFDPNYTGYAIFPDGSWASQGIFCQIVNDEPVILENKNGIDITDALLSQMSTTAQEFIQISNLLLTSDYYKEIR